MSTVRCRGLEQRTAMYDAVGYNDISTGDGTPNVSSPRAPATHRSPDSAHTFNSCCRRAASSAAICGPPASSALKPSAVAISGQRITIPLPDPIRPDASVPALELQPGRLHREPPTRVTASQGRRRTRTGSPSGAIVRAYTTGPGTPAWWSCTSTSADTRTRDRWDCVNAPKDCVP
jgi:hypothetical protein